MSLPQSLVSDQLLRKAIIYGVILILGACIISQVLLQLGGPPRDEKIDVTDQFGDAVGNETILFDPKAPFISSGGAFYPEKAVFDVGLFLGGLLFIGFGIEIFLRTQDGLGSLRDSPWRSLFNLVQLLSASIVGGSLVMLTQHPYNVSIVMHIVYAMAIFQFGIVWMAALTLSRWKLDSEVRHRGWSINRLRLSLTLVGFASFQLMTLLIALDSFVASAFFEWTLTFAFDLTALTLLPIIARSETESD